jgi:Leucine-rich repeat (LRR) protein
MKHPLFLICSFLIALTTFSQNVTIPDANFKAALIQKGVDKNGDGQIQKSEALNVDSLSLFTNSIVSIVGIEEFTNLVYFSTQMNAIDNVDFTKNKSLVYLNCSYTNITSIDLSQNSQLKYFNCGYSKNLKSLDLSSNVLLEKIYMTYTKISSIDFSKNINLKDIDFSNNSFTKINVSKNINLEQLNCSNNNLTSLAVDLNNNLTFLDCTKNNSLSKICINDNQSVLITMNHNNWNKDSNSSWSTDCSVSIVEIEASNKSSKVLRVYNLIGQEIMQENANDGVYIFQYSDGSAKKKCVITNGK